ncbi:AAA domain-containing protein [Chitinophaga sp. YR627]|uniref:P-loop NTPase n=1 Tax=Chitinophaga sp. YR627 TaxID=1881041 RepID=UPI0008F099DA|nr:AAA family ATPase [Chitinophaga sp. YR627]SFO75600.1 AAA domain-containing protein [Chitinophaga sp. YR627]
MINFKEINTSHRWEQFAEAFFKDRGAVVIQKAALGQDGGADLIIEEEVMIGNNPQRLRILVSCKFHFSSSIGISIENDILDRVVSKHCNAFYGFYSTNYTSGLQVKLDGLITNSSRQLLAYTLFDDFEIESYLKNNLDNNLFRNYFETSYKEFIGNIRKRIEENTNFKKLSLEDIRDKKDGYPQQYYSGEPPNWSIIKKHTFQRDIFTSIISTLDKSRIALVTGAGGEGKSTLLMQIGSYYLDKKYQVYYSFEGVSNIDILEIQFDKGKEYLIIIDQASYIENLYDFIKGVKLKRNIKLVLGSRKNEWIKYLENSTHSKDLQLLIGKDEYSLSTLSMQEVKQLGILLRKEKMMHQDVSEAFEVKMQNESQRAFLLATMILATKGQKFEYYIADVINNIRRWENGFLTLKAISFIVAIEILHKSHPNIPLCSDTLLLRLMEVNQNEFQLIKRHLAAEAFFQQNAGRFIHTRNPLIAEIYFQHLLGSELPVLSLNDVYTSIIYECAMQNQAANKPIIAAIPPFLRKLGNNELALELVRMAISHRLVFKSYLIFVDDLVKSNNIGDYYKFSARWLCKRISEINPRIAENYSKWTDIELEHGAVGSFENENTVRWIFKQAFNQEVKNGELFSKWARLEVQENNLGDVNIDHEFSARWIYYYAFKRKMGPQVLQNWASVEIDNNNIGELNFAPEYSARWIFKHMVERYPISNTYNAWADLEIRCRNFGDIDFKSAYSARWLLRKSMEVDPHRVNYLTWAKMEIALGNIGSQDGGAKYSARWILRKAFDLNVTFDSIAIFLAKLEYSVGYVGRLGEVGRYSARWILQESIDRIISSERKGPLLIYWARLEANQGNYGSYDTRHSALNILKRCYDENLCNITGFLVWSAIQFYLNVSEFEQFSPRNLFEMARGNKSQAFYLKKTFTTYEQWKLYLAEVDKSLVFQNASIYVSPQAISSSL